VSVQPYRSTIEESSPPSIVYLVHPLLLTLGTEPDPTPHGLVPPALAQNNQYKRNLLQLRSLGDRSLEKYIFLSSLKQWDEDM
jgi:hypothetical protein